MIEPKLLESPDTLARIQNWLTLPRPDAPCGPRISDYTLAVDPRGLLRLVGQATGHPRLGTTWVTTSPVWQLDPDAKHARTSGRWYTLGDPHPAPAQADGSPHALAIYGSRLTATEARAHLAKIRDAVDAAARRGRV